MFETQNIVIFLDKKEGDTNKFHFLKSQFLSKQKLNNKNFNYYINIANCYANYKINGCIYDEKIMNEIINK